MTHKTLLTLALMAFGACFFNSLTAQTLGGGSIHGNFEANAQYYNPDSLIGAPAVPEKMLMNGFANFIYSNDNFSAGLRYESYLNPLQGFDPRFKGSGIPYRFISYKNDGLEVTVGSYYEQFGSGMIFRSYEERGLGYDNAMDGIRAKYTPIKGIYLKGVIGKQRSYFSTGPGIVRGFDGEINFNEAIEKWAESKTKFILGGSFVSKFQDPADPLHVLPANVGAYAGRINIIHGKVNISGEYAYKINDPSYVNNFIYKPGQALMVNANYSKKGFAFTLAAARIDNMDYRSDRNATINDLLINFLPVLCKQHTYALGAFYPYASQPNGEMAGQAELVYNFKPNTFLGGKYGTNIDINFSKVNAINKQQINDSTPIGTSNTDGYKSDFFSFGKEMFFQDINVEITHKVSKGFKFVATYMDLYYNKDVVQGKPGFGTIHSQTAILEMSIKLTDKKTLRTELQHMATKQDQQNWAMALAEYTVSPHWYIAALDLYNYGNDIKTSRIHYPNISAGYTHNANRFSIGYGKQRAGIFCVGGVCRTVPASNGFTFSVTSSF